MAKQPKKPAAKKTAAKKTPAKKTAAPKVVAKKPAAKKAAKKPATAAKKPTAKKAVKKPTTKKAAPAKPAKKPSKTASKKQVANTLVSALGLAPEPANPTINAPGNGAAVPANADLKVTVGTNRTDLSYTITVTDTTANPPVVTTVPVNGPVGNPFDVTVPGAVLTPSHNYTLKVTTNPPGGGNGTATINIATRSAGGIQE